jgi:hypothetical protein
MKWILENSRWLFDGVGGLIVIGVLGWLVNRFITSEHKSFGLWNVLARRGVIRRARGQVARDIRLMTPKEKEIIGYLLAKRQNTFTYTVDGGYASTLISKRIVVCALLPGQVVTRFGMPFTVPDFVWDVLVKHKAEFPNTWKTGEPPPWVVSWMVR